MTFYSDENVATRYLDPKIFTENARCSFSLDSNESAYLPNMRLLFLGAVTDSSQDYNHLLGALALVKNARLLDGKTILCSANEHQFYQGFLNVNQPNEHNQSAASYQSCSALGLTVNGTTRKLDRIAKKIQSNTKTATTGSATLDLRTIFPMLTSVSHLPTALFQSLRIEIEFDAEQSNQIVNNITTTLKTLRPVLAVDVIENPALVDSLNSKLKNASWLEIEHDQFVIPGVAQTPSPQGKVQATNVQISGFNNKRMERFLMVKVIQDSSVEVSGNGVLGYGRFSSQACFRQKVQLRVNGNNLLPRQGIVGNNERLAHIVDAYGDCSAYIGSNQYGGDNSGEIANARAVLGQLDYIGIYVGADINNFQINYSREGLLDTTLKAPTTQTLISHCYAEIRKQLIVTPNGYTIQYA